MKRVCAAFFLFLSISVASLGQAVEGAAAKAPAVDPAQAANSTAAAAAVATGNAHPRIPDFSEHIVDEVLALFDVRDSGNSWQRYAIAGAILVVFYLLRRVVMLSVFGVLKKLASRTRTTFDDKLFPALEAPAMAFVALLGIFLALRVLRLSVAADEMLRTAATVGFSLCFFWALIRVLSAFLDHLGDIAKERKAGVAAFMPWIKKSLVTLFAVLAVLMIAQSLGANVKAFLAGLGIGGLAFALAAQDTIANLFGSVVVAVDQPFKIGEFVRIGSFSGAVEDIGLRSTKLRAADKSLIIIPNKTVAAEGVTNLARFTQRRVEQVIGLTYDTSPKEMEGIVEDFRRIILAEAEVDATSVMVFFQNYGASSLDVWVAYVTKDPDFQKHMQLRQRINLAFMRAVQARGLSFAFPTQTVEFGESARKALASRHDPQSQG